MEGSETDLTALETAPEPAPADIDVAVSKDGSNGFVSQKVIAHSPGQLEIAGEG